MITVTAGDLTVYARGLRIETDIPVEQSAVIVDGILGTFQFLGDFANVQMDGFDFMMPKSKPVRMTYENAREWLLREDDADTRVMLLDAIAEHQGKAVVFG